MLKVPAEAVDAYMYADQWTNFQNIIGMTEEEINALRVDRVRTERLDNGKTYSLGGVEATPGYKGIIIQGSKKLLMK